jgi:beta-carotene ketolase (CrtO type)
LLLLILQERFERSFMLSANTDGDLEEAFARIQLGELPPRPPLMLAFPSALEPGWAPDGRAVLWLSTFVPWRLASGPWDRDALERAAGHAWRVAERALGTTMEPLERRLTGPAEWGRLPRQPARQPQPRRDEHRPAAGLPALPEPFRLPHPDRGAVPDRGGHPSRRRHRPAGPQRHRGGAGGPRAAAPRRGRRLLRQLAQVRDAAGAVRTLRQAQRRRP